MSLALLLRPRPTPAITPAPPAAVASVSMAPSSFVIGPTITQQLVATVRDAAGAILTGRTVTWTSSNPSVATVSATGLVTGVAVGSATITATCEGVSGTAAGTIEIAGTPIFSDNFSDGTNTHTENGVSWESITPIYTEEGTGFDDNYSLSIYQTPVKQVVSAYEFHTGNQGSFDRKFYYPETQRIGVEFMVKVPTTWAHPEIATTPLLTGCHIEAGSNILHCDNVNAYDYGRAIKLLGAGPGGDKLLAWVVAADPIAKTLTLDVAAETTIPAPGITSTKPTFYATNNKLLALWATDYSTAGKLVRRASVVIEFASVRNDYQKHGQTLISPKIAIHNADGYSTVTGAGPLSGNGILFGPSGIPFGEYGRVRVYADIGAEPNAGILKVWINNTQCMNLTGLSMYPVAPSDGQSWTLRTLFNRGYFFGAWNITQCLPVRCHIDNVRIHNADPGW